MTKATTVPPRPSIREWIRTWRSNRARVELDDLQEGDLTRIASDIGVSPTELRTLAAMGTDSADLLPRRLASLGLGQAEASPGVLRDMERVCTFCGSKRRCAHDLDLTSPPWPAYCPNAETLGELVAGRATGS